jgi:N-acetylglutamate synthase-like GNAT family acetyltransferase
MIRKANKFDVDRIIEMLINYREQSPLNALRLANDREYIEQMLSSIFAGAGVIFVSEKDGVLIGMLIAAKFPNIWNPQIMQCSEIAYWVEPEYRGGTSAYRLLNAYVSECEQLKKLNQIDFYTVSKMVNSPNLKYERFGFEQLEQTWVH